MSDFRARILAELDASKIPSQLQKISRDNTLVLRKIRLDTSGLPSQIQASLDNHRFTISLDGIKMANVDSQMQNAGKTAGQSFSQALVNRINTQLNNGGIESSIAKVTAQYEKLGTTGHGKLSLIEKDLAELGRLQAAMSNATDSTTLVTSYTKYNDVLARVKNSLSTVATDSQALVNQIKAQLKNGGIEASIAKVAAQYEKLGAGEHKKLSLVKDDLAKLEKLQTAMKGATDPTSLVTSYTEYNNVLQRVRNTLATITSETKSFVSLSQINSLDNQISSWLQKNTKATNDFGADIEKLRKRLSELDGSCEDSKIKLDTIEQEFRDIKVQAQLAGKTGKSFGTQLTAAFKSIWRYVGVSTAIYQIVNAFKQMFQNVYNVNTAMTELKKVTDETDETYDKFLDNAGKKAQKLGTTISELVKSTADFARLGFSFSESESLAEVANIYSVVGDEIENIDAATQSIISTMAAFKIEADDAITIVDKFNAVGNNFAISSGSIGEALQRSASSLAAANNTLDESIALITAANTVVQDADSVGKRILPTLKITISVKSQRWSRPRKDFIDVVTRQLGRTCFL